MFNNSSTFATLSAGNNSEYILSILISFATLSAASFLSPVSITILLTPSFLSISIAFLLSSFISSVIAILPIYFLSTTTYNVVLLLSAFFISTFSFTNFSFPTQTSFPSTLHITPFPAISCRSKILLSSISSIYAFFTDVATGCDE